MSVSAVSRIRDVASALSFLMLCAASAQPAVAQSRPPFPIIAAGDTARLEHEDRKARLRRLSSLQDIVAPEFYEYTIPRSQHHLRGYPDLPVLRVVFSERVFFDFNRDNLRPEADAILETVAESLRLEPPDVTVFVAGHTDAVGSVNYNLDLGLRRAKAVAIALARRRVNRAQIFLVSFGKAVPIASNDSDAGRARNRRVEFLFAARPEPIAAWLANQRMMICAPNQSTRGDNCPTDPHFIIKSVSLVRKPQEIRLSRTGTTTASHLPVVDVGMDHAKTEIKGGPVPTEILIGSKTIDIDLVQKTYTMAAPE
jgi:outer membrane protein OmpA-like peptidoglycan-associated protein